MARALVNDGHTQSGLKTFTDCMYFISGHCKLNDKCLYRHCLRAAGQINNCSKWPKTCRDINCPYRHPAPPPKTDDKKKKSKPEPLVANHFVAQPQPQARQEGFISFFWDIENVPIPKAQKPFDIVQRIRQKLVVEAGLREYNFTCYCNSTTISQDNQLSLFHANVRIVHVPDRKPGAVDRQIMLELDRFERAHRPPATIVLISGDIDFVGKLSDLRHQAGFHVIVIHNKPAKSELKATVNAHYAWELFTQPSPLVPSVTEGSSLNSARPELTNRMNIPRNNGNSRRSESSSTPPVAEASSFNSAIPELASRVPQTYRLNTQKNNGNLRRTDPSPNRVTPPVTLRAASAKRQALKCPKCTSEFDSLQALRQHQEAKDHLFDCPICDESFTTLDGQTQHQRAKSHYPSEYKCGGCTRRFTKLDSLRQHQQATDHNGFMGPGSSASDEFLRGINNLSTIPKSNSNKNNGVQNDTMFIIQQGIEALVQYFPKNNNSTKK